MANRFITIYRHGLNKELSSKLHADSRVRQKTPDEGRMVHQPKYNKKSEDNSPNTIYVKKY